MTRRLPNAHAWVRYIVGVFSFLLSLAPSLMAAEGTDRQRPNILVIMTDDLGYSDLGCYGSEIDTPHLDQLANNGLRFSQFYNTAKCHSSRISLLTGLYAIQAGDTSLSRAITSAEVLGIGGYSTSMVGKWHLKQEPTDFGFQRYWGHLSGACNYFSGDNTFRLNGEPWKVPEKDFYTTVANVDYAIDFLNEARQEQKPWYLYVAFNAPHAPLQPLKSDYEKYLGRYDVGWDTIRDARIAKQTRLGLFGGDVEPSPRPDHVPAWETLSEKRKRWESHRMAAYAGMIDRVDQELGRLIDELKSKDELDNTLILFVSDNGACPYDRRSSSMDAPPYTSETRWSDSTGWAWARNAPFRFYKQNQFEGGISTPGIVHWPAGLKTKQGSVNHDPVHLVDVLPTLAEIAQTDVPRVWSGREPQPLAGTSFANVLRGEPLGKRPPIHLLFASDRGLRDGPWKLVSFRGAAWELYHIPTDRSELHNVAAKNPEVLKRMVRQWHDMAENVLHANASSRKPVSDSTAKVHREWTRFDVPVGESAKPRNTTAKRRGVNQIRARIATKVREKDDEIVLDCQGTDSGIAIDRIKLRQPVDGPYRLNFQINSRAAGEGEIYFTTDGKTSLPRGKHQSFAVNHDGTWHDYSLQLDTTKQIAALRFDPCSKPGFVRVRSLTLTDVDDNVLFQLPAGKSAEKPTAKSTE